MFPSDEVAGSQHTEAAMAHERAARQHAEAATHHFAQKPVDAVTRSNQAVVSSRAAHQLSSCADSQTRALGPEDKALKQYVWAEGVITELGGPALMRVIRNAELSCGVSISEVRIFLQQGASPETLEVRCEIVR
ncbi:MAG: hypothetical protein ACREYD_13520 [Casimicrobiaceae bacterium]